MRKKESFICKKCCSMEMDKCARGLCKICYAKEWRKKNTEHLKNYDKERHKKNPIYKRMVTSQWRKDNIEHVKEYKKQKWRTDPVYKHKMLIRGKTYTTLPRPENI